MISFIILHYKAVQDTMECIESILSKISCRDFNIIVVDNGSNDGSGQKLLRTYQEEKKINILIEKVNAGFANGNNIGCRYAISHYSPDFLVVLNNDTIIDQSDFIDLIYQEYKISEFDMLGPDIITLDGIHQNPTNHFSKDLKTVKKRIFKLQLFYFLARIGLFVQFLINMKQKKQVIYKNNELSRMEDVPLHGSALIFSKKYYESFKNVFFDQTYMYCEEDILYHRSRIYKLKTVFNPEMRVKHKEDVSTNLLYSSSIDKELFVIKNTVISLKALRDMIKDSNNE